MSSVKKGTPSNNICQTAYINTRGILDVSRVVCINSFHYADVGWKRPVLI